MKYYLLIAMIFGFILSYALSPRIEIVNAENIPEVKIIPKEEPTHKQSLYLAMLEWCESGGNPNALNPQDGGSRSVGSFQFKDKTFSLYSQKYALGYTKEDIYDHDKQKALVHLMLKDGLEDQWKNCHTKIGSNYPKN